MEIKRTDAEINDLTQWVKEVVKDGESYHFDRSYEEGVLDTLEYLQGRKVSPMTGIEAD